MIRLISPCECPTCPSNWQVYLWDQHQAVFCSITQVQHLALEAGYAVRIDDQNRELEMTLPENVKSEDTDTDWILPEEQDDE